MASTPGRTPPPLASPVCSPASVASSRGTKRPAAASDDDDDDDDDDGDQREDGPGAPPEPPARPGHADDDASARARRLLPKRLRRSASRDMSLPKLRPPLPPVESAAEPVPRAPPRRLARLALPVNAPGCRASRAPPAARDDADAAPAASPRRPSGPRNLRPRIVGGPLRVVPDDNRGIPGVPAIPAKFARPEDRENHAGAAVESCP